MLSAQKRANPFEDEVCGAEDVRMDVCSSASKRGRWEEAPTPLRKRSLNQSNLQGEPTFTLKDLERARDEGRMQSSNKIRALISANEALKHALNEAVQERDKLASDCKVLKTGVITLNNRSHQMTRELEQTQAQLREESERSRSLQSAIIAMHANWSLGGCRKDDQAGSGSNFDGDVF
jgi:chromosome segregation ATPase